MKVKNKLKDWKEKSKDVLLEDLRGLKEKLMSLRFLSSQGKLKNVREIKQVKKDIARILTLTR